MNVWRQRGIWVAKLVVASAMPTWIQAPARAADPAAPPPFTPGDISIGEPVALPFAPAPSRPVPAADADLPLRRPLRVILDSHARVPSTARLFAASGDIVRLVGPAARTLSRAPAAATGERAAHRIERIATDADGRLSLPAVLAWLGGEGINEVWTEAGPTLAGALLTAGLVDELVVYLAPRLLGPDARPLAHLPALTRLADAAPWRVQDMRPIGPDIRIMLRPES